MDWQSNRRGAIMATKESANYNVEDMSFNAGGIKRTITLDAPKGDDAKTKTVRKLILMGARNVLIDSVAAMTIKGGFTEVQRVEHMGKVLDALNAGENMERAARGPSIAVSTFANIGFDSTLTDAQNLEKLQALAVACSLGVMKKTDGTNVELTDAQTKMLEGAKKAKK
jgi:hypothetical protein